MTNTASTMLRVTVEKSAEHKATYLFTINCELRLSAEYKRMLSQLGNDGRHKTTSSNPKPNTTVISIVITRGPNADPVLVLVRIRNIVKQLAKRLLVRDTLVIVEYLAGRMAAMTLADLSALIEGVQVARLESQRRQGRLQSLGKRPQYMRSPVPQR